MNRNRFYLSVLLCLLLPLLVQCRSRSLPEAGAEHVFTGGKIYTANSAARWADAVAVDRGAIVYVGDAKGVEPFIGRHTEMHDLKSRLLLPAFMDTHAHPMMVAGFIDGLQLDPRDNRDAIVAALRKYARSSSARKVLVGFGFNVTQFGSAGPRKEELDAVVADKPVILVDDGGHSAWVNSRSLEELGIDKDTPDPIPGAHFYKRDTDGRPTGWMVESQTFMPALVKIRATDVEEMKRGARQLFPVMLSLGVTTVFDAGMSAFEGMAMTALQELERDGELPLRYLASHEIQNPNQAAGAVVAFRALQQRYDGRRLHLSSLKLHNDGTKEARTAAMLEPYGDDPGNSGAMLLEGKPLRDFVEAAAAAEIDVHVHSIGDRTAREVLDAVEDVKQRRGLGSIRITLCHLECVDDADLPRFAPLGVIAQTTPLWHSYAGEAMERVLGPQRFPRIFRFQQLHHDGVRLTFGSDFPASEGLIGLSPIYNIEVGHTRQKPGQPDSPIQGSASERLDLQTLVDGYTIQAAYQLRLEQELGSIETGKRADLIVLDRNIFDIDAYEIHKTKVELTMIDGKVEHKRWLKHRILDWYLGL